MRKFKGNFKHSAGSQIVELFTVRLPCSLCGGEHRWRLGHFPDLTSGGWHSLKLAADGWACAKGNYWLGYHVSSRHRARSRDWHILEQNRLALCTAVLEFLDLNFSGGQR